MAKTSTMTSAQSASQKKRRKGGRSSEKPKKPKATPEELLAQATALLQTSQADEALVHARRALALLQPTGEAPTQACLPALALLGEINIELGDVDAARAYFTAATVLDPDGSVPESSGGGAEKFMWLAQLCEEGGEESVAWFEKGADVLRRDLSELEGKKLDAEAHTWAQEKGKRLGNALCGIAEVYMTDLSFLEEQAEKRCEEVLTEALLVAPNSAEPLQTLASVRISQSRHQDAREYLKRSMELWKDLPPEDPEVPDFPTRISLTRLLIEASLDDDAIDVLDRLVTDNDSSVEAWYLGGWLRYLKAKELQEKESTDADNLSALWRESRKWLNQSLRLYRMLDYEDERLREHAEELVADLDQRLGGPEVEGEEDEDEDVWEGIEESEDEKMEGT